jgi:D-alanyl-D-alanine carboxypeptidase
VSKSRILLALATLAASLGAAAACAPEQAVQATPTTPGPSAPTADTSWTARLQRALDSAVRAAPVRGASAAVVLADGREWRGAAGLSEPGTVLDPAMRLGIGSISKNITAALLVRLAEQGKLSLDDPLSRWLPPIAFVDPAITVRQVLNHTSGVFDLTDFPGYRDSILADVSAKWTPQRALSLLRPPLFPRGTGWSYSNSNYQLAGLVAEAVMKRPVHEGVRVELLTPLSLSSLFLDQAETPTGPLATGWVGGTFNVMSTRTSTYSAAWMAGAYFATASDLARWWQALMTGRVVNAASLAAMMTPVAPENYGLGMSRRVLAGRTIWSHTGEIRGFSSVGLHDPAKRASLVVIVNENPGPAVGIAGALLTIVAGVGGP